MQIVLFCQTLFWVFYASAWRSERTLMRWRLLLTAKTATDTFVVFVSGCAGAFFTKSQAILNMEVFLIVTAGFIYYGRNAYIELRCVGLM